ncbi:MAG TPA: MarR family transcriptional regulator [Mycobacteriales bacterium]|nr:MarR family transcriptional regulator [Mycobacteriales bacterium]
MPPSRRRLAATAWGALLQVHAALVPAIDRRLRAATGLPLSWYDVLLELQAAPEHRLTMSQLGERVVLSRTRVSRVVDEMAGDALVRRDPHPQDARSAYAVLTDAGLDRFRAAAPVYLAAIEHEFAAALADRDLRVVGEALGRVRDRVMPTGRAG